MLGNVLPSACDTAPTALGNRLNPACPAAVSILGNLLPQCSCVAPTPFVDLESDLGVSYAPILYATDTVTGASSVAGGYVAGDTVAIRVIPFVTRGGLRFYGPSQESGGFTPGDGLAMDWSWDAFFVVPDGVRVLRNLNSSGFIEFTDFAVNTVGFTDDASGWTAGSTVTPLAANQVPLWADQSGNANDVSQATEANNPLYVTGQLNGFPEVRFQTPKLLSRASLSHTTNPFTVHGVFTMPAVVNGAFLYVTVTGFYLGIQNSAGLRWLISDGANVTSGAVAPTAGSHYFTVIRNVSGDTSYLYIDGVLLASGALGGNTPSRLQLQSQSQLGFYRVQIFQGALTSAQRIAVELTSKTKYAL